MVHETLDAVFEEGDVKVDEQTEFATRQFQVRDELRTMRVANPFDGFYFNYYATFNQQIHPVVDFLFHLLINQRQWLLPFDKQTGFQ